MQLGRREGRCQPGTFVGTAENWWRWLGWTAIAGPEFDHGSSTDRVPAGGH